MPAARAFEPQLILISIGFDAHRDDPLGTCALEASSFAEMARWVRSLADSLDVPLGGMLEGGYDLPALASSCAATLEALRDGGEPRSVEPHPLALQAARVVGRRWPLPVTEHRGATS